MDGPAETVFIVDDDDDVRRALGRLLATRYSVRPFESAADFLRNHDPDVAGCVVLDLAMPGLSGLDVQSTLAAADCQRPLIFLSGHGSIPESVHAMRAGAVTFLTKPVESTELLAAIGEALVADVARRRAMLARRAVEERLAMLTPRERQVLAHVLEGRLNKQIAGDLGTVVKTIKVHRARVMHKMRARSLAQLVRMVAGSGISLDTIWRECDRPRSVSVRPPGPRRDARISDAGHAAH